MTKPFRARVVGWSLAAFVCLGGLIVLGLFLPELTRQPGESQLERYQREKQRVRDSIQKERRDLLAGLSRSSRSLRGVPREAHSHDPAGALRRLR